VNRFLCPTPVFYSTVDVRELNRCLPFHLPNAIFQQVRGDLFLSPSHLMQACVIKDVFHRRQPPLSIPASPAPFFPASQTSGFVRFGSGIQFEFNSTRHFTPSRQPLQTQLFLERKSRRRQIDN
jgi:hypothetical protein